MRKTALLAALLLGSALSACESNPDEVRPSESRGWEVVGVESHPVLLPGVEITNWATGRGSERERRSSLRVNGVDEEVLTLEELAKHCQPIETGEMAMQYASLAQRFDLVDIPVRGDAVDPDPSLTGRGASGRYGYLDASSWDIDFPPEPKPYGGGYELSVVILTAPIQHKDLKFWSPWRLLWVRQVVYPDGSIHALDEKLLTNADDAARYAPF